MNFKDKKVLIIVGVIAFVLIIGAIFFLTGKKSAEPQEGDEMSQEQNIPTISKEELDLTMAASSNNQKVKFSIGNSSDIKHIEYEITYDADSEEDASVKVPKGITGDEDIDGSSFETDFLDLGTCSKNVCRYDTGIKKVDLLLKITKRDGKVFHAQDSLILE